MTESSRWRRFIRAWPNRILLALVVTFLVGGALSLGPLLIIRVTELSVTRRTVEMILEGAFATSAVLALIFVGRVLEGRSPSEVGLRAEDASRYLGLGAVLGVALSAAAAGILALFGWYRVTGLETISPLTTLLEAVLLFGLVAVFEEVVFRGVIFRIVEEGAGSAVALVVSSVIFGAIHMTNPNASTSVVIGIAIGAGILLGAAYMLTRSLWMAIGIHWTYNLTEVTLLGMPAPGIELPRLTEAKVGGPEILTGGSLGPEAGAIGVGIAAVGGVLLLAQAIRVGSWVPLRRRRARQVV